MELLIALIQLRLGSKVGDHVCPSWGRYFKVRVHSALLDRRSLTVALSRCRPCLEVCKVVLWLVGLVGEHIDVTLLKLAHALNSAGNGMDRD